MIAITPLLKQLHWLPVPYRIQYRLSLTIHKAIHHNSPDNLPPSYIYTHPSLHSRPVPPTPLSLPLPIYTNSTLPIYHHLPSLPLTTRTPCPITYKQTHQLPPLNATLRLIISPLPSLPLNNSIPRTAVCSRTDTVHKPKKVKVKYSKIKIHFYK